MADGSVSVDELWAHAKTIFAFARQIRSNAGKEFYPTDDLDAAGLEKAAKLLEQAAIETKDSISPSAANCRGKTHQSRHRQVTHLTTQVAGEAVTTRGDPKLC